jgi:hypothetical protein
MHVDLAPSKLKTAEPYEEHEQQVEQTRLAQGQMTVRTIRSLLELEDIRDIWESWHNHPNSDIDFYSAIVDLKPEIERPHVLLLYRDDCPEAMIVGRMERAFIEGRIGYKTLYKRQAKQLTFNYGGQLGNFSESNSDTLVREVIKLLRTGEADLAMFNFLRVDSPLFRVATTLPGILSRDLVLAKQLHRCTTLPDNIDALNSQVSPKIRKNKGFKKLLKDFSGVWEVRCLREPHEVERLCQDVERVAKTTYQRGLGVGFVDCDEMRRRLLLHAEKGWLRTYILYLGEKPCAFWMGTLYKTTLHSDCMGYDPEYAKCSPGTFLIMRVIEGLCSHMGDENVTQIDWGLGDAEYKAALGTHDWQEACVYIFAPTIKGLALNVFRTLAMMADVQLKRILERVRLVRRIKRLWRDRLMQSSA